MLVSCLAYTSALRTETCYSEISADFQRSIRSYLYIPKYKTLHRNWREETTSTATVCIDERLHWNCWPSPNHRELHSRHTFILLAPSTRDAHPEHKTLNTTFVTLYKEKEKYIMSTILSSINFRFVGTGTCYIYSWATLLTQPSKHYNHILYVSTYASYFILHEKARHFLHAETCDHAWCIQVAVWRKWIQTVPVTKTQKRHAAIETEK
jgi:hypothetical protein